MEGLVVPRDMYCSAILKGDLHLGVVVDSVEADRARVLGVTGVTGADKENVAQEEASPDVSGTLGADKEKVAQEETSPDVSGTLGEVTPHVGGVTGLRDDGFIGRGATMFLINGDTGDGDAGEGGGRSNVTDFTSSAFT